MKKNGILIVSVIATVLLTFGVFIGTLWWIRSFQSSGTSADLAKLIGSVIALVGTLFTAMVTLVGLLLKHSLDTRNAELLRLETTRNLELKKEAEERLKMETERNFQLNKNAEERLKLEAAIRAFELFKTAADSRTSTTEAIGALFALTKLGQLDFALQLLKQLWPQGGIDSPGAVWVINKGLEADSKAIQEEAAELLRANAERLPDEKGGHVWPYEPETWKPELSVSARISLLEALLLCFLSRKIGYWDEHYLVGTVLPLSAILETDDSPHVRSVATLALQELLNMGVFPKSGIVAHGTRHVDMRALREKVRKSRTGAGWQTAPMQQKLGQRLQEWVKDTTSEE